MSNNCLVTKLKGTVQNDNLPRLGIVTMDFDSNSQSPYFNFHVFSATKDVHVKSKVPFTLYGTSTKVTEYTAVAGIGLYGIVSADDVSPSYIENVLEFDNMYDLSVLYMERRMGKIRVANNLKSAYKYAPLEIVSLDADEEFIDIPDNAYGLHISSESAYSTHTLDLDSILDTKPNLEALFMRNQIALKMLKNHNDHTTMKYSFIALQGNMTNLPKNLEYVNVISLSGNVEDYVARMRELGRTSGFITLQDAEWGGVKYNNTNLKTLIDNNTIHNFGTNGRYTPILTWTPNSIVFATSLPEGAITTEIFPSEYFIQKHSD